jgi:tetratricopeptide (TPR) repeat protein
MIRRSKAMRTASMIIVLVAASFLAFGALPSAAHQGLHEQIDAVAARIEREPGNARLYLQRGEFHRLHRDWEAALADYRRAEELDTRLDLVKFARGRMYHDADRPQDARVWLDRYIAARPDHVEALVTRARVLVKLEERAAAIRDYSHAIELLARPNPEHYIERARALMQLGSEHEALTGLDEGIRRLGPVVALEELAIELEVRQKRYDAALSRLEQISARSPRKERWLARRGDILLVAGRGDEARESYRAALTAIESLSPRQRATKAIAELESRVRAASALPAH